MEWRPEHDSILAMAEAVLRWAPPMFALAGHSMGGRVAFQVYRLAPERVTKLAVFNTGSDARSEPKNPVDESYWRWPDRRACGP